MTRPTNQNKGFAVSNPEDYESNIIFEQQTLLDECIKTLDETRYWLRRMKDLHWDDPEYAPRFKASMIRHEELLTKLRERKGDGQTK